MKEFNAPEFNAVSMDEMNQIEGGSWFVDKLKAIVHAVRKGIDKLDDALRH
jgi:hypothetical protein